jgi:hypothetical protein
MAARTSTGFVSALLGGTAFADIFLNGRIEIYSGAQPASADAAVTGTLLATVTRDGGAWAAGAPGAGLRFSTNGRFATKDFDHNWVMTGIADGTAGWYRLRGNAADAGGVSLLLPRLDGAIGLPPDPDVPDAPFADVQLYLSDLLIAPGLQRAMPYFYYTIPSGEAP